MKKRSSKLKAMSLVCLSAALIMATAFSGCAGGGSKKAARQTAKQTETVSDRKATTAADKESEKETKKVQETETETKPTEKKTEKASEPSTSKVTEANVPETVESVTTATEQPGTETSAADPAAASEQAAAEQPETVEEVYEEPENNTGRMELSDYMYEEGLQSLVEILELQEAEARQFGMYGVRYEGGGMSVEWQPVSDTNPRTVITINCAGNDSVSMYGVYCGQSYADAKEWLLQSGWHIVGNDLEHPAEFYIEISEQEHDLIHLVTEEVGDTVSEWMWLNWPQGELVIN